MQLFMLQVHLLPNFDGIPCATKSLQFTTNVGVDYSDRCGGAHTQLLLQLQHQRDVLRHGTDHSYRFEFGQKINNYSIDLGLSKPTPVLSGVIHANRKFEWFVRIGLTRYKNRGVNCEWFARIDSRDSRCESPVPLSPPATAKVRKKGANKIIKRKMRSVERNCPYSSPGTKMW